MNRSSSHKTIRVAGLLAAMTLAASIVPIQSRAADLYWGGWDAVTPNDVWTTAGNWYTDAAGTTPSASAPTIADNLFFNVTPENGLGGSSIKANVGLAFAANSLTHNSSIATIISQVSNDRVLTLGTGGITNNGNAFTLGTSSGSLSVQLTGDQTWTNNSSTGILNVRSLAVSNTATGPVTLTLNAASTRDISFALAAKNSPDNLKSLSIIVDSAGTGAVSMANAASTFSGGITVKRGVLQANTNSGTLGTGKVQLGDTSGSATARLNLAGAALTLANDIDVRAGSSGIKSISVVTSAGAPVLTGNIALFGDLLVGSSLTSGTNPTLALNGVISGTGDLTVGTIGTRTIGLTLGGANTFSGDTIVSAGSLTLAQAGSLKFYIGENGVNNQVRGGGTNVATFNGTFAFDLSAASLVNGNSWTIVDVNTLTESFAGTFAVAGFTEADNVWTNGGWSFYEATGILSYSAIPEPSTYALLAGAGLLAYAGIRRKGRRSAS